MYGGLLSSCHCAIISTSKVVTMSHQLRCPYTFNSCRGLICTENGSDAETQRAQSCSTQTSSVSQEASIHIRQSPGPIEIGRLLSNVYGAFSGYKMKYLSYRGKNTSKAQSCDNRAELGKHYLKIHTPHKSLFIRA